MKAARTAVHARAQVVFTELAESSWRTLLFWLGAPGLAIAGLALLTLAEPRKAQQGGRGQLLSALAAPFSRRGKAAAAAAVLPGAAAEEGLPSARVPARGLNRVRAAV